MPAYAGQGVVFLPFSGTNKSPHSPRVGWQPVLSPGASLTGPTTGRKTKSPALTE